jgi:hypothetical protein
MKSYIYHSTAHRPVGLCSSSSRDSVNYYVRTQREHDRVTIDEYRAIQGARRTINRIAVKVHWNSEIQDDESFSNAKGVIDPGRLVNTKRVTDVERVSD